MASTFDSLLRLELQATGENVDTWGTKTNNNLELIAAAIAGATSISIAGSGDYTLTTANAATDQARQAFITLTGTLTGNRNIIVPSSSKIYFVRNNTSGAFSVTFKTSGGTGALVPQGFVLAVACDGTDCFDASEVNRVAKTGDTMTGALVLPGNPTTNLQAAPKQYVDTTVTTAVAAAVPAGIIVMWSGAIVNVPSGWALCDGSNGTPNLRDRFVVGAGSTYAVAATGGAASVTLTSDQIPSHNHTFSGTTSSAGAHNHAVTDPGHTHVVGTAQARPVTGTGALYNALDSGVPGVSSTQSATTGISLTAAPDHTHTISGTSSSTGGGQSHENLPPYYALAYIMKL